MSAVFIYSGVSLHPLDASESFGWYGYALANHYLGFHSIVVPSSFSSYYFVQRLAEKLRRREESEHDSYSSSLCPYSPGFRQTGFSETGLPILIILGNPVSDKRGSWKLRIRGHKEPELLRARHHTPS